MTTSIHYKSNVRDTLFNLFELLEIQNDTLGKGPYASFDEGTARESLTVLSKVAAADFAASFVEADRTPLKLDGDGNVTMPPGVRKSLEKYYEGAWDQLDVPAHLGGLGAPPSVRWAGFESVVGSNAAVGFYIFGVVLSRIIDKLATEEQKKRFVGPMIEHHWGGSMMLTEPDAGSDVGEGRAKARQIKDDLYEIEGVKRFITNGDFDYPDNIIHLVLARPEGAGPGTKGLSMFIVPKFMVNDDGSLGERNGVYATNIEKKMGIKASATCEMTFGDRKPARGYLVGNKHDGIRQMFAVIEQARMGVGIKSIATASTAYLNALAYTKERKQGPDLTKAMDKTSPRVAIIEHADVRRMLMTQKAHVEGMRALALFTAHQQDLVELAGGHGAKEAHELDALNDLLLPLVKGYCSEKSYDLLAIALQCFGGSGYTQDYPIEQYIRDQKIDTLYEGTTHIQALDLFFRKVARDGGKTLQVLLARIRETASESGPAELDVERKALTRAIADVEGIFGAMMGKVPESLHHVGLQANRVLFALAELVIGWLLLRSATIAHAKVGAAEAREKSFYQGKLASARFFAENVLPGLTLTRKLVEQSNLGLMSVPEEAFGLAPHPHLEPRVEYIARSRMRSISGGTRPYASAAPRRPALWCSVVRKPMA